MTHVWSGLADLYFSTSGLVWSHGLYGLVCKLEMTLLNDIIIDFVIKCQGSTRLSLYQYTIIRFLRTNFQGSSEIHKISKIYCTWKFPAIWYLCYKTTATASYQVGSFLHYLFITLTYFVVSFPTFYRVLSEVQSEGLPTTLKSHTCPKKFNKRFM